MRTENFVCHRGQNRIYGTLYLPDGKGEFPLLIYSHGYGWNYEEISLQRLTENGIATARFDFCGGSPYSQSDGKSVDMSVLTEADDLDAVIDVLKVDKRIDESRMYLCGNSQGGYVSALEGIRRKNEITALFLLCPAFVITDFRKQYFGGKEPRSLFRFGNMNLSKAYLDGIDNFPIYEKMREYTNPVTIYHGTADTMAPISYSEKALHYFPNAQLIQLNGCGHMMSGFSSMIEEDIISKINF